MKKYKLINGLSKEELIDIKNTKYKILKYEEKE